MARLRRGARVPKPVVQSGLSDDYIERLRQGTATFGGAATRLAAAWNEATVSVKATIDGFITQMAPIVERMFEAEMPAPAKADGTLMVLADLRPGDLVALNWDKSYLVCYSEGGQPPIGIALDYMEVGDRAYRDPQYRNLWRKEKKA